MKLQLRSPLDMHLHFREGDMLKLVAPLSAHHFAGGVIMPNLISPVNSIDALENYLNDIRDAVGDETFTPYMTLFFKPFTREELKAAKPHVIGVKLYPAGVTTQSESGVSDFSRIEQTLSHMQELEIPLLVHGETGGFVMEREHEFLSTYTSLAESFPKLQIIMEHITTAAAVDFLEKYENVSATVTLHHLMITLDDVAGGLLEPDLFCKPIAKTPNDREALRKAVFSGHSKIMFGSDSAPHPRHKKECVGCAAGIFTAPVALPLLAELFEDAGVLDRLQAFVSDNGCRCYGIAPLEKKITLVKKPWRVPERYGAIRPFFAGKEISWSIV